MTEHLIASTLTALVAVVVAALLRNRSAKFRFAIFLAGLLRFAVPTSWLSAVGESLAHGVSTYINTGITRVLGIDALPAAPPGNVTLAMWIFGAVVCLALSARRWLPHTDAVREATLEERELVYRVWDRLAIRQRVDVRIVGAGEVPAACGIVRPYIALPEGLTAALTTAEMDAILAHELAHVARRDNLWAALVRAVVSVFWFHPLVWWIEHRLLAERETACDEFVLAHGATRQDYVTGIAKVCRIAFAGPPAFAGITGANLKTRAAHILTVDLRRLFGGPGRWAAASFTALAILAPMGGGFLAAQPPVEERIRVAVLAGKTGEVIALLEGELAQNPTDQNLRQRLAIAYVADKRYDAALGLYEQLLFEDPNSADLLFKAAEMNRRLGKLDKALELFERAASADPFKTDASLQQALLLDGTGQRDLARPVYEKILEVKPNHPIAANNLAYLLVEDGHDMKRALALALTAHQQLPDSPDIADTLGLAYLRAGMPEQAIAAFHSSLAQRFDSAMARSHMLEALDAVSPPTPEMQELRVLLRGPVSYHSEQRIGRLLAALPALP